MKKLLYLNNRRTKLLFFFNWINRHTFYKQIILDFFIKKFINFFMIDGKKDRALIYFNKCCFYLKLVTKLCPIFLIRKAIYNSFFLFDHRLIIHKTYGKQKRNVQKINHSFGFISYNLKIKRALRFLYYISNNISQIFTEKIFFSERIAIGILYIFFKKGEFENQISYLYKLMLENKQKLKEILNLQKNTKIFMIKQKRARKDKGFYLFNPYSLSNWYKEMDRSKLKF
jgi:hypothetical protein